MASSRVAHLLAIALFAARAAAGTAAGGAASAGGAGGQSDSGSGGGASGDSAGVGGAWERTLQLLWAEAEGRVGFCVGARREAAARLMKHSWPVPPLDASGADAACANHTAVDLALCSPLEVDYYVRYLLWTEDVEKLPPTAACGTAPEGACSPGFFQEAARGGQAHPCCPGYFCPPTMRCMIPCPLGTTCPRAHPAPPPPGFDRPGTGGGTWCAPYAYKLRPELGGCGGAHRWDVLPPPTAFPLTSW